MSTIKTMMQRRPSVPREYGGKWVAWSPDGQTIVATADTPKALKAAAHAAGRIKFSYEWIPPANERFIGNHSV